MSAQKGSYDGFVLWDKKKTGGRFFECLIGGFSGDTEDTVQVTCHDGAIDTRSAATVFRLQPWSSSNGTSCIAYCDTRPYAFAGSVTTDETPGPDGKPGYQVLFDDGAQHWIERDWVYSKVNLQYETKYGTKRNMVRELIVRCEFVQRALLKHSFSSTIITSNKQFKDQFAQFSGSASAEGSYGAFSAAASATWEKVTRDIQSSETFNSTSKEEETEFQQDVFHIFRVLTVDVKIGDAGATEVSERYVNIRAKTEPHTDADLVAMAKTYMKHTYDIDDSTIFRVRG